GRAPGLSCIPCLVTDHGHWQDEKAALTQLNTELDARVAARTARIERLAQDARHAAMPPCRRDARAPAPGARPA
ncbi:MAG TPA: hypothetical protein PK518_14615, partial [Alicycliphilus sp.]|nr:hypothetical protein [Alicycliphilus sp.]